MARLNARTIYGVRVDIDFEPYSYEGVKAEYHLDELFQVENGFRELCPDVRVLITGPRSDRSFYLVTTCMPTVLGRVRSRPAYRDTEWDRQINTVLDELGWITYADTLPMWHTLLDQV